MDTLSDVEFGENPSRIDRCRDLLEEERFTEAYPIAVQLIAEDAANPAIVSLYCDASIATDRAADAIRAAQTYTRAFGWDVEVQEFLAGAQWALQLYGPCRKTCRRILAIEPKNYIALDYGLATTLELGDFEEAQDILDLSTEAADQVEADDHIRYQTAVARMMRGKDPWAQSVFESFLENEPREPGIYINLMRIHHLDENYEQVAALYDLAAGNQVEHEDLDFNMGLALKAQERDRKAAPYFIRALRRNADLPDANFHLGQILRTEGHLRLALWMLQRELSVDDTHPAVHAEMAWCAEDLAEYDAAVRMIQAAVERAPKWAIYQHSYAELLLKNDPESEEAARVARTAVELDPTYAAGWQILGRLQAEHQQFDEAERSLAMAIVAVDTTAEDKGWYGLVLAELGRGGEAVPFLETAARVHTSWLAVAKVLGELRGSPLPSRYEVRFEGQDDEGRAWYRVLHVVADDEAAARAAALDPKRPGVRSDEPDITGLGFEVDHAPGVVWDSGATARRYPAPPPPKDV